VYRIAESGKVESVWDGTGTYPGRDLVRVADELYFWTQSPYTVYRLPLSGEPEVLYRLPGDAYVNDLVEGAGLLYVHVSHGEYVEVVRIDPVVGEAHPVLRWAVGETGAIAADDGALYATVDSLGAFVRVPHDAPALPDLTRR
jgi:hypothetical protein